MPLLFACSEVRFKQSRWTLLQLGSNLPSRGANLKALPHPPEKTQTSGWAGRRSRMNMPSGVIVYGLQKACCKPPSVPFQAPRMKSSSCWTSALSGFQLKVSMPASISSINFCLRNIKEAKQRRLLKGAIRNWSDKYSEAQWPTYA